VEIILEIIARSAHYFYMNSKPVAQLPHDLWTQRAEVNLIPSTSSCHISDHDLERYHLGMVTDESELAKLEGHLLWCGSCVDRAEESARHVDVVRAAIIIGKLDLE
jgi:hypothetical protein